MGKPDMHERPRHQQMPAILLKIHLSFLLSSQLQGARFGFSARQAGCPMALSYSGFQLRAPGTVQGAVATWCLRGYAFNGARSLPLPVLFRAQVARISKPL